MTILNSDATEAEMVEFVVHWIDLVGELLTTEASRRILQDRIRLLVGEGTIPMMQVIEAAEGGHGDADMALRELAAEMIDRHEALPTALGAYVQRALIRPPVTYPQGRNIADTWVRDIGIAILVRMAAERWGLPIYRPSKRQPAACFIVSLALSRNNRVPLSARRVGDIFADQGKLAGKLSASIPPI